MLQTKKVPGQKSSTAYCVNLLPVVSVLYLYDCCFLKKSLYLCVPVERRNVQMFLPGYFLSHNGIFGTRQHISGDQNLV